MGMYIEIKKIKEKDDIAFYEVKTEASTGAHFYLGIDKNKKCIHFYAEQDKDMKNPVETVMLLNLDKQLQGVPGVSKAIFARVVLRALEAFKVFGFPEYLSHCA